ncbi:unnamed protein product [Peronospora belbahrii]|uniref:Uncharacterized protein n=1 Tax=Peronospora belbahrii TaxID=622444 RepID=A0AAU9KLM3_9STRA|nr:unnamed protein product [Peronospora belbahrii]
MASSLSQHHVLDTFDVYDTQFNVLPKNWSDMDQEIFESFLLSSSSSTLFLSDSLVSVKSDPLVAVQI